MKYYIGELVINDHSSERVYSRHVCVAAANEAAAQSELDAFASEWESNGGRNGSGGWFFASSNEGYTVFAYSLREISAATFDEMAEILTPLGDASKVSLADKEPAEAIKAVSHRLGEQLNKLGASVPQGKLLRAASAALGATGWAQLKAKMPSRGVKPEPVALGGLPRGNPKREPLYDVTKLDFAARVDAIWLADGDVALAARLLHVDPEALLASFEHAMEADVAFCSRPAEWRPEHSLARDFGILAEARFKVTTEHKYPGHTQVQGWYEGQEVVGFNDHIGGSWHITGMTFPRGSLSELRHQLACYYEALRRAVELNRLSLPAPEDSN